MEERLRKGGVPLESIRRISMAMASKRAHDTMQGSTPTLDVKGQRCVFFHSNTREDGEGILLVVGYIECFHSVPWDSNDKGQGSHVGVPNKRS